MISTYINIWLSRYHRTNLSQLSRGSPDERRTLTGSQAVGLRSKHNYVIRPGALRSSASFIIHYLSWEEYNEVWIKLSKKVHSARMKLLLSLIYFYSHSYF